MVSARFALPLMLSAAVRGEDTPDFADVADEEACEMQQTLLQVSKGVHKSRAASHTATVETQHQHAAGVYCGMSGRDGNGNIPADCSACHHMGECNGDCAYNPSGWCVPVAEAGVKCGERSALEGTRYESCNVCYHMGECNTDCAFNWNNWCVPVAEAGVQCGEMSSLHGTRYESCGVCYDMAECNTDCARKWDADSSFNRESCVPVAEAGVQCGEASSLYGTRYESCGVCYDYAECNTDCAWKWDADEDMSRESCVPLAEAGVHCGDPRYGGMAESCAMCASIAECNTDCHFVNGACVKKDIRSPHFP